MKLLLSIARILPLLALNACQSSGENVAASSAGTSAKPPIAPVRPYEVKSPHGVRIDPYYWLRDDTRSDKEVLGYLRAENAYADAVMAHTRDLQETVYEEIVGRIKQDDSTVPDLKNGYWYYTRFDTGKEYPIYARRKGTLEAPEQVMLNFNEIAEGHSYFKVAKVQVSPDNRLVAWTEDIVGRFQHTVRVKNLETGEIFADTPSNTERGLVWADNRTLLYISKDPVTLLGNKVRKHVLGTDPTKDLVVYEQKDNTYYTLVGKTKDERYLTIVSHRAGQLKETRVAPIGDPQLRFRVLIPREPDHEYKAEHLNGRWILLTNWRAKNFRIVEVEESALGDRNQWRDLVPHRTDAFIDDFDVFRDFLAVQEHSGGLSNVRIVPWNDGKPFLIESDEPAYAIRLGINLQIDTPVVRYLYASLTTPQTTYDFDTVKGERTLLKREPVLGYDQTQYVTEHVWAAARDGTKVPVSLVYRKGTKKDGTAPLLQYGYGSYGASQDPNFSNSVISLLDRGFVYALAHIRGGQEMGRDWFEDGNLLRKMNTFNDFIDVTRFLVAEKYVDPKRAFAQGMSAGGLLMGGVANMAPNDYRGIVAGVPFVDVATTMLDASIPLTTTEYHLWGDPQYKEHYEYMLRYSPYDNVAPQDYPALFVRTGLWDSQCQYFEAAKWVAKLRSMKTDSHPLVLRTNMEAGHGGKSGRFGRYREIAEEYAFMLDLAT